jgi:hypothetical protein
MGVRWGRVHCRGRNEGLSGELGGIRTWDRMRRGGMGVGALTRRCVRDGMRIE